jgi:hypothetical protein
MGSSLTPELIKLLHGQRVAASSVMKKAITTSGIP